MNSDIKEQIEYLSERVTELENLCTQEVDSVEVSGKVRNITQDILTRANRLVDNILFGYWNKKIVPNLSSDEVKKFERQVMFPVREIRDELVADFSRFGLKDPETNYPDLFSIVEKYQPYHSGKEWIKTMRELSNLGHRRLIPQKKRKISNVILGGGSIHIVSQELNLNNTTINGIPDQNFSIVNGKISGSLDPRLDPQIDITTLYCIEDTDVDAVSICSLIIDGIRELSKEFKV